jgi:hypothetical protein
MMPPQVAPEGPQVSYAQDRLVMPTPGALRPLGQVLRALPTQYRHVLRRPSVSAFSEELTQAEWRSVWVQLLLWALIEAIVGFIVWLIVRAPTVIVIGPNSATTRVQLHPAPYGGQLLSVPLGFFFSTGAIYLVAKLLGGRGTFLAQSYASVLVLAPLGALASIIGAIPYIGILAFVVDIYALILHFYAVSAAHRVSVGRAVAIVLLPIVVFVALIILVTVVFSIGLVGSVLG